MKGCMEHDEDFTRFAGNRWSMLVRSGVLLGCSLHEAEDLAQNVLARCYTSWERLAKTEDVDAYTYRILVNCLRDSRRRRWWGERPTADTPDRADPRDETERIDIEDSVHRALRSLSRGNRSVVVLRFFVHLTERQTAEALRISTGTVKSRQSRALAQLSTNEHLTALLGRRT